MLTMYVYVSEILEIYRKEKRERDLVATRPHLVLTDRLISIYIDS